MCSAAWSRYDGFLPIDSENLVGGSNLRGEMRKTLRRMHYSIRTEEAYLGWARRVILFYGKRHPKDMGGPEITAFETESTT